MEALNKKKIIQNQHVFIPIQMILSTYVIIMWCFQCSSFLLFWIILHHKLTKYFLNSIILYISEYSRYPTTKIYIYTGDTGATPEEIIKKAKSTFNVSVDIDRVNFIYLNFRGLVEGSKYPYFTLILQSLGSMVLGFEAILKLNPG